MALVVLHSSRTWLQRTKTWIYEQLRCLPSHIEAHVVCDTTENLSEFPWERLHVLAQRSTMLRRVDRLARQSSLPEARFASLLARQLGAHVLHSHFGPEAWRERRIAHVTGMKHVVTFYGHDVTRVPQSSAVWRQRYRELFKRVDLVLCEGPHMREEIIKLGCPDALVQVHHLGVQLRPFAPRSYASGDVLQVLLAASFREKKGLSYALRGVAEACARRPALQVQVTVIGGETGDGDDEREASAIREAARAVPGGSVSFVGFKTHQQLFDIAARHHVLISPSVRAADGDTEGGAPVALIELAAVGMLVISTVHCDIPNVLRGPAARLLAQERDASGIAERLLWLVDNPAEWSAITGFVRAELEQRFDAHQQGRELASRYLAVAQAPSRAEATWRARRALNAAVWQGIRKLDGGSARATPS